MAIKTSSIKSRLALLLLGSSTLVLVLSYIVEYGFRIKPCNMCLYERIPYYVLLTLSAFYLVFSFKKLQKVFRLVCLLVCLSSAALALYHVGIERGFIEEPAACSLEHSGSSSSLADIKRQIYETKESCKEVKLRFFALSMAEWNLCLSLLLIVAAI